MDRDRRIQNDVESRIVSDPRIDPSHIAVKVAERVVTLTGIVGSYLERFRAENAVLGVRGVRAVDNRLAVEVREPWRRLA